MRVAGQTATWSSDEAAGGGGGGQQLFTPTKHAAGSPQVY